MIGKRKCKTIPHLIGWFSFIQVCTNQEKWSMYISVCCIRQFLTSRFQSVFTFIQIGVHWTTSRNILPEYMKEYLKKAFEADEKGRAKNVKTVHPNIEY